MRHLITVSNASEERRRAQAWKVVRAVAGATMWILVAACTPHLGGELAGGQIPADQWAAALDDSRGAVVKIEAQTCAGLAYGTGFVLDDTTVITNAHVVSDAKTLSLETQSGTRVRVTVAASNSHDDLAAMTTVDPLPPSLPIGKDPVPGDLVRALGYPGAGAFAASEGRVVRYVDGQPYGHEGQVLMTSAKVGPGNSGGPLVDRDGAVAGVVFAIDLKTGFGLAVPVSVLAKGARATWPQEVALC